MTPILRVLARLEEVHGAATPGRWIDARLGACVFVANDMYKVQCDIGHHITPDDATAIAISHNAFPALLKIAKAAKNLSGWLTGPTCNDCTPIHVGNDKYKHEEDCGLYEDLQALRVALESLSKVDVGEEK